MRTTAAFRRLVTALAAAALVANAPAFAAPPSFQTTGPGPPAQVLHPGETCTPFARAFGAGTITSAFLEAPAGMSVSQANGLVTWTPGPAQTGVHDVRLRAQNAEGRDEIAFRLAVEEPFFQVQILKPGASRTRT